MKTAVCFLVATFITSVLFTAGHGDQTRNFTAVLGQTVTLYCPGNTGSVVRLYIQKNSSFINGFDRDRKLPDIPQYVNRTTVNPQDLSMEMRDISVSDEGSYQCVVFYNQQDKKTFYINLKVTAEYRAPNLTEQCSERTQDGRPVKSCQLNCWSVGGYPQSTVNWTELNPSLVVHNENFQDPVSKTWTINQTRVYNCSHPINVSCSIGGSVSNTVTICTVDSFPLLVIVAIFVVLFFVVLFIVIFVTLKFYQRRRQRQPISAEDPAHMVPLADCHSQPQAS